LFGMMTVFCFMTPERACLVGGFIFVAAAAAWRNICSCPESIQTGMGLKGSLPGVWSSLKKLDL